MKDQSSTYHLLTNILCDLKEKVLMDHTAATSRKNGSNTIIPKSYSQVTNIQCHLAKTKLNWFNGYLMALVIMGEGHKNKGEKP